MIMWPRTQSRVPGFPFAVGNTHRSAENGVSIKRHGAAGEEEKA